MNLPTSVTTFQVHSNFPTAAKLSNFSNFSETFQLQKKLSNFARFFPTSIGSFQLRLALSNFGETFQLQTFQLKTFQLLVLSNCPFQLHVSRIPPKTSQIRLKIKSPKFLGITNPIIRVDQVHSKATFCIFFRRV